MSGNLSTDFKVMQKLGEGSFAEVFKAKHPKTQQIFAIKRLKKRYRSIEEVNKLPEVLYLRALQGHPNIVKLYDVMFDSTNGYVAMVFELMDVNLYELVRDNKKPYDEKTSLLLIYQLLKALDFMHSKNLFHRDVKPENCMVDKNTLELKLCDFGSTRQLSSNGPYTEYVSTRWYRAPECILTSGSYGPEVDIWAVGCMLYELVTSRPLFPGKHEIDQISRIHNVVGTPSRDVLAKFRQNPNTQISFSFPQRFPQDFQKLLPNMSRNSLDLLQHLLIYNPSDRITAHEALDHPAFELLRVADQRWVANGCRIPFSVFFQQVGNQQQAPPRPPQGYGSYVLDQQIQQQMQQPQQNNPPQVVFQQNTDKDNLQSYLIATNANFQSNKILQNSPPLMQQQQLKKNSKSFAQPYSEFNSMEARLRAVARIREYNHKKLANQKLKKHNLPQFHFDTPSITKPLYGGNNAFQKPRPELIQPRLPKITNFIH